MDKSMQQQFYANARSRQSQGGSANRKTNLAYAGGSLRKSIIGAAASRFSISGRSNQSMLGIRSDFNVVESYGFQLPVVVTEALTFGEKQQNVSVNCSENGWAWVVNGRRLLIWQYKDTRNAPTGKDTPRTPQRRAGAMAQCRELTLPHCDIGHKATLICAYLSETQQMASCIAVSPTGDVRYWPSIAHDSSTVDVTGILDGQEFDYLLDVPAQNGYLLVTTTCNLVFVQLQLINGRHVLQHKTIKQAASFLGGIGKRFASYLIGVNSSNDKENKFVGIASQMTADNEVAITLLADHWLQRWRLSRNGISEQLLYEDSDIVRRIREDFQHKYWPGRDTLEVDLHLLDMHLYGSKIYVLTAGVNLTHTPNMYYAVAILTADDDAVYLDNMIPLKITQFFNNTTEKECLSLRFIICRNHLYLYSDKVIYPLSLNNPAAGETEAEKIDFHMQDDRILCALVCGNIPLFFSRTHGLVCVTPGDFDATDFMLNHSYGLASDSLIAMTSFDTPLRGSSSALASENNLCIFELDPDAIYNEFKDEVSQMKAAFVYHLKRNKNMCNTILNELLRICNPEGQTDALSEAKQLDKIVITIAEDLAEDIPAADPRWEQLWNDNSNRHSLGSSASLQIITQLKEKNLALRHFVDFLHATGIWEKLNAVPSSGGNVLKPTIYCISDINEKIVAAIALRSLQNKYSKIIDKAINHVVQQWQQQPKGNLTAQDLFYVHICKFQDIFQAFCDVVDDCIESQEHQMSSVAAFISDMNAIMLKVCTDVITFREQHAGVYNLPTDKLDCYEYLPWTAMTGTQGVRDALSHFVQISVRYGVRCANEAELKQKLYQQLLELIDLILDGRKTYLDSVRDTEKYSVLLQQFESQRRDLICILIDDRQYEFAAKLAEKYLDFQSLVVICDETNNQERLDAYIKKYEEYDFSQYAINWHLRQNRQGEVFERFKGNQAALSQFMRDHPTLGWIQLIFNGDFERAAKILYQLAQSETEYVNRKRSMLSLAKLSAFAAADSDLSIQVENINVELNIIEYQEQLSEQLLTAFGYEVENQRVLRVEEIIHLLISDENETANEFDFRKALELLNYMEDPYEARHKIWCAAILRDNWTDYDANNALNYLQGLLFFKLIELCHLMGDHLDNFLPPIEEFLDNPELGKLTANQSYQYLLKLTYEFVTDTYKQADEQMEMEN